MERTREPEGTPTGGRFATETKLEPDVTLDETVYDEDGYAIDEWGHPYGYCNSCGEEAPADGECCDDGEIVPVLGA